MKSKWCISAIVIFLALFVVNQQQIEVPNQEIVLQFTNDEVTSSKAQTAIAIVKQQLQAIGIDDTRVVNDNNGRLKIIYYSDSDVAVIKNILSNGQKLVLQESTSFPLEKDTKDYDFDVYEIQNQTESGSGVNGKFVLQSKQAYDGFTYLDINPYLAIINTETTKGLVKVALKINNTIAIAIDTTSQNIPESRAGPFSTWNS